MLLNISSKSHIRLIVSSIGNGMALILTVRYASRARCFTSPVPIFSSELSLICKQSLPQNVLSIPPPSPSTGSSGKLHKRQSLTSTEASTRYGLSSSDSRAIRIVARTKLCDVTTSGLTFLVTSLKDEGVSIAASCLCIVLSIYLLF